MRRRQRLKREAHPESIQLSSLRLSTQGHSDAHTLPNLYHNLQANILPTKQEVQVLQRQLGNKKTQQFLVQRKPKPIRIPEIVVTGKIPANPLPTSTVNDAKKYYQSHRKTYTPALIRMMETKLKMQPTGRISTRLIQNVARWQMLFSGQFAKKDNHLKLQVDGIAGPLTLPQLLPTGLGKKQTQSNFANDVISKVLSPSVWKKLGTVEKRGQALINAINKQLDAEGIPEIGYDKTDTTHFGTFDSSTWQMQIRRSRLAKHVLPPHQRLALATIILHEARHAEQAWRAAQYLAHKGVSAKSITKHYDIDNQVAKWAHEDKGTPNAPDVNMLAQGKIFSAAMRLNGRLLRKANRVYTEMGKRTPGYRKKICYIRKLKSQVQKLEQQLKSTSPKKRAALHRKLTKLRRKYKYERRRFTTIWKKYRQTTLNQYINLRKEGDAHRVHTRFYYMMLKRIKLKHKSISAVCPT